MKERLREKPPKDVSSSWHAYDLLKLPGATTTIEIDFSKVSTTTHNKLLKLVDMYPESPGRGYGWRSEAGRLFRMLSSYFNLPTQNVSDSHIYISGLTDESLWESAFELCYADAIANRMETGSEYQLNRLVRGKELSKTRGDISYYWGSEQFHEHFMQSEQWKKASEWLRNAEAERIDKVYQTIVAGGLVRYQY